MIINKFISMLLLFAVCLITLQANNLYADVICVSPNSNLVTRKACKTNETRLSMQMINSLSLKGETGPRGPKGDTGPQGPSGVTNFQTEPTYYSDISVSPNGWFSALSSECPSQSIIFSGNCLTTNTNLVLVSTTTDGNRWECVWRNISSARINVEQFYVERKCIRY